MTAKKEAGKWLIDYASEKQRDACLSNLTIAFSVTLQEIDLFNSHMNLKLT